MSIKSLYNEKNKTNMDIININIFLKMEKNGFGSFCSSFFYNFAFFCVFIFSKKKCKIDTFFLIFDDYDLKIEFFCYLQLQNRIFRHFLFSLFVTFFAFFCVFFAFFTIFTIFSSFSENMAIRKICRNFFID